MATTQTATAIVTKESDASIRLRCLEMATDISLRKGDADGQSVLRRANAFYSFITKGETPNE